MYSDLFDALGGGAAAAMGGTGASTRQEPEPVIAFKAGKMEMTLQENGKYYCVPDTRRAKVQLRYGEDNALVWEWYDRREKNVSDTIHITSPVALTKVDTAGATQPPSEDDDDSPCLEVYYWKLDNEWKMLWLQDKEIEEGLVGKINDVLKHPTKPAEPAPAAASGDPSPGNVSTTSSASTTTRQVDALSSILENLGMPQGEAQTAAAAAAATASSTDAAASSEDASAPAAAAAPADAPASGGGTLTLADLQGAMAGLQNQAVQQSQRIDLQEVVSSEAITELLANEDIRNRLLEQLPEDQRSAEHLEENLRSPQVQSTLRSLSAALMPDDNNSLDGYHSVFANFQLDPEDGIDSLEQTNNPIEAFLQAILASVKDEKPEAAAEESKDDEMKE